MRKGEGGGGEEWDDGGPTESSQTCALQQERMQCFHFTLGSSCLFWTRYLAVLPSFDLFSGGNYFPKRL
jgi:hypothetical protein